MPLTRLKEENKFRWGQDKVESLNLEEKFMFSSSPQSDDRLIVDPDTSNVGIGCNQDGEERVIGYFRKTLSKPEIKNCSTRQELLDVVKVLDRFHKYVCNIYGRHFTLYIDH
ncbi:uncharacterized protein LOC142317504 [Lycorma delicatula]|uniref:uncharacterized protein LOC142317504 n=1 Tax=Lycorma delicatula TaxID=130591 RepID=UPI003F5154D8